MKRYIKFFLFSALFALMFIITYSIIVYDPKSVDKEVIKWFETVCLPQKNSIENIEQVAKAMGFQKLHIEDSFDKKREHMKRWIVHENKVTGTIVMLSHDDKGCWVTGFTRINNVFLFRIVPSFLIPAKYKEMHQYILKNYNVVPVKEVTSIDTEFQFYELDDNGIKFELEYEYGVAINKLFPWAPNKESSKAVVALRIKKTG